MKEVSHIAAPVEEFHRFNKKDPHFKEQCVISELEQAFPVHAERKTFRPVSKGKQHRKKIMIDEVIHNPELVYDFVNQMSDDELCLLNVSTGADWYMPWEREQPAEHRCYINTEFIKQFVYRMAIQV